MCIRDRQWVARASLTRALDVITNGPAFVRNGRMDVLAANLLGRAFYDRVFDEPGMGNLARFCFLDERSREFYPDWDAAADVTVAILRTEAGRDPRDKQLHDLVGELSTRSDAFRIRWGAHNVRRHGSGTNNSRHHRVGDLTLSDDGMGLTAEPGLSCLIYTAEPGSPSQQRLDLLASFGQVANWRFLATGSSYNQLFSQPSPVRHFWSLAIEEQAYLVIPFLCAAALRFKRAQVAALGVALGVIWLLSALSTLVWSSAERIYYATDTRASELCIGAILATVVAQRRPAAMRVDTR